MAYVKQLAALSALGAALAMPTAAHASATICGSTAPFYANYQYDLSAQVTAIAKYTETANGCGAGLAHSDTQPVGLSLQTDVFAKTDPLGRTLLLGVAYGLPGDAAATTSHLVVFGAPGWAAGAIGHDFAAVFPGVSETALIDALTGMANGNDPGGANSAIVFNFDATQSLGSTAGDPGFRFGGNFVAVAFSNGQSIGTGTTFASGAVPEPAAWATMFVGLGLAGFALRRRPPRPVRVHYRMG